MNMKEEKCDCCAEVISLDENQQYALKISGKEMFCTVCKSDCSAGKKPGEYVSISDLELSSVNSEFMS